VCPFKVCFGVPESVSQIRAVLSPLPVARRLDDTGENCEDKIGCPCPGMRCARRETAWTLKTACGSALRVIVVLTRVSGLGIHWGRAAESNVLEGIRNAMLLKQSE
jgi:hypothetical protein